MEFIEGSRGVYKPIRVMFDTPIYERALQTCWHMGSYKSQIALVIELLRLQQKNRLPSEVTAEDMTQFLVEESKSTLRVQLWEFELEDYDVDVRPLLRMVWEVNTSMKMRDVEFEARRLLTSPEAAPPQFQHPKIISQAQMYARSLTEQQQEARGPKQLSPREVVIEVVPKVLQGFWLPPPNTHLNMPSQQLSKMAVGVTKAVEDRVATAMSSILCQVPVSRSIRDDLVLSIQEKVRQGHTREVLVKKLNCFATEVLNIITNVAAREICALFQPQTHSNFQQEVSEQIQQATSTAVSPPPSPLTPFAKPPASIGFNAPKDQPTTGLELKSAVNPAPPCPMTPPAEVIPSVLDTENRSEEPTKDQDSATNSAPPHLVSPPAEEPPSVLDTENNCVKSTKVEDSAVDPAPPRPVSPPAEVIEPVLDTENRIVESTREPDSDMDSAPPCPKSPPAKEPPSVLDTKNYCEEPTKEVSVVDLVPPQPVSPPAEEPSSVLDTENKIVKPTREPDSDMDSAPPCPVSPPAEKPPSVLDNENNCEEPTKVEDSAVDPAPPCPMSPPAEVAPPALDIEYRNEEPTTEPDSPVVPALPSPVNSADEPPDFANQEDVKCSQAKKEQQPTLSPGDADMDSAPPCPMSPPAEKPPSDLDTEKCCEEPTKVEDSSVDPAAPCPMSPPAEVTEPVLDIENRNEEPTTEPDSPVVPASPSLVNPADEPPDFANQEDVKCSQAKKEQQPTLSPEPPHVTPPAEVTASVLDDENKSVETANDQDSAVDQAPSCLVSPPAEVIRSVVDTEHESEEPTGEPKSKPKSTLDSAPPACITPSKEAPAITVEQDDLAISQEKAKVKSRGKFKRLIRWCKKKMCCCFLPGDDTETSL